MAEPANQMQIKVFNVSANILPEMKMMRLTTTELAFFRRGKITKSRSIFENGRVDRGENISDSQLVLQAPT